MFEAIIEKARTTISRCQQVVRDICLASLLSWTVITLVVPLQLWTQQTAFASSFPRNPDMPPGTQTPGDPPCPPLPVDPGEQEAEDDEDSEDDEPTEEGESDPTRQVDPEDETSEAPATTEDPIMLISGDVIENVTDFMLPSVGFPGLVQRNRSLYGASGDYAQGLNWMNHPVDTYLYQRGPNITLLAPGGTSRTFIGNFITPTFVSPSDCYLVLTYDSPNQQYILTDQAKNTYWRFNDFTVSNTNLRGLLVEQSTLQLAAQSLSGYVYSYNSDGSLNQITSPSGQDYSIVFTWSSSYMLQSIQYQDASANAIAQIDYTYSGDVSSPSTDTGWQSWLSGLGGNLLLLQVKVSRRATNDPVGTMSIVRYTQYRYNYDAYYTVSIKSIFEHDAIERIVGTLSGISTPEDIMQKDDTYGSPQLKDFASRSFTYYQSYNNSNADYHAGVSTPFNSSENFQYEYTDLAAVNPVCTNTPYNVMSRSWVASETIGGCGSCGRMGSITKYYNYLMVTPSGNYQEYNNEVNMLVVEDTVDSAQNPLYRTIYGLEGFGGDDTSGGRMLRKVRIQDPTGTPTYWCESWIFATSTGSTNLPYRLAAHRYPSAHTCVASASDLKKFLNPYRYYDPSGTGTGTWVSDWSNDTATVNTSAGKIETFNYNSAGFRTDSFVQNGTSGTPYYTSATDYGDSINPTLVTATYDYPTQTTTRSSGLQTNYSYTFYDSSTHQQIQSKITTYPTVPTTQNGSGVATTTSRYYDNMGRLRWTQDGEGYVNYYAYHPAMGKLAYKAIDVDPSSVSSDISSGSSGNWDDWTVGGANSNKPTRSSSLPTPLAFAKKTYYDSLGRKVQVTDAAGAKHYTAYSSTQTIHFPYWDSTNSKCLIPIRVSNLDNSKQVTDRFRVRASYSAIATSGSAPVGFSTVPAQSDYVEWTHYSYDSLTGLLAYTDSYASIPSSGTGTLGTDFYRAVSQYDLQGRVQYNIQVITGSASNNRVEQVTKYNYDVFDRITQVSVGVSGDTAANSHDMTNSYNVYPALYPISQTVYDGGGTGDGYITKMIRFFGATSTAYTGVNNYYTYRGDLRGQEPFYVNGTTETAVGPYRVMDVDWKGRPTTSALYSVDPTWSSVLTGDGYSAYAATTAANRSARTDTLYDNEDRNYQEKIYSISSSTGSGSNYLSKRNFYDRNDRVVATASDNAAGTEIAYDGAGRAYQSRTVVTLSSTPYSTGTYNYNAPIPNPSLSSMSGGDSGVLTLNHLVFDANSNVTETDAFEDNHDDVAGATPGINLTSPDYVRRTVFKWYDQAGRLTTTANYGSGDPASGAGQWKYATLPTRPSSAPTASSSTALVMLIAYNSDSGLRELETDSASTPTKMFYDRLGRVNYTAQNYSSFNPSTLTGTGGATDRVTQRVYGGPIRLQQLIALDSNGDGNLSDNQVTTYLYEDPVDANRNTSLIYPDSTDTTSSGTNQVKLSYDVDGSLKQRTDQNGTVIAYSYSNNRLIAYQSVATLGTGVDGIVRSIAYTYDALNRKQNITSYGSTNGTGTVINDVQFTYNDLGQVTLTYQSHSGAVNTSSTPNVQYAYDSTVTSSVFSNQSRLQSIVYPNGRTIYYDYGSSLPAYNALSKVRTIWDTNTSGTALANYDYNGAGTTLAAVTLAEPSLKLDYFQGSSGTYAGFDRFGRVIDHYWRGTGSTSDADRTHYGYDYASNRTYRDIDAAIYSTNNLDQVYGYDGLYRLSTLLQGTLSGSTISGTPAKEEDWTLDGLGNWPNYVTKASGTTTLNQSRTANSANEITAISATVGSTWATPAYDASGNMTTIPEPAAPTTGYTATYDAWNRLVKLVDSATSQTVQQNQYDGRNFRVVKLSYSSGTLSETRHAYYTDDWRCVEERVGSATTADRQFVWGGRYIDDLILRDRGSERLYALQDSNWSVTSIVNASGAVQERYDYTGYGTPAFLTASFGASVSSYDWETLFDGYRFDSGAGLFQVRNRTYHAALGNWVQRDPLNYVDGMSLYAGYFIPGRIDPLGLDDGPSWVWPWDPQASWTPAWSPILDTVQVGLDGAGMVPVAGAVPDLTNAAISGMRGRFDDMAFSAAAAIPFFGDAATAGKYGSKAMKAAHAMSTANKAAKSAKSGNAAKKFCKVKPPKKPKAPKKPKPPKPPKPRTGAKRGPKTNGEGPHNKKIRDEADKLEKEGNKILHGGGREKEKLYPTPGGNKEGRRPDIVYETPDGQTRGRNVGKTKADGTPVKREVEALEDLNGPGKLPTDFVPYDRPQ